MDKSLLNILLAFLEGLAVIVSPCILPILPIILSGSVSGGKRKPLGIIVGFILFFVSLTLFFRQLIKLFNFDDLIIFNVSLILLGLLSLTLIFDKLSDIFSGITQSIASYGQKLTQSQAQNSNSQGFKQGLLIGSLIAFVWTPCAGPILGTVLIQSASQKTDLLGFLTVLAFCIGVSIPMFLIMLFGRQFIEKFPILNKNSKLIRKIFGFLILISVMYLGEFI